MRKILIGLAFLVASLGEVCAQAIVLPCVPSGNSCIPVSAANPLPTTGGAGGLTVGTTTIASGSDTGVLFQDGASPTGVLQQNSAFTFTKGTGLLGTTTIQLNGNAIATSPAAAQWQYGAADVNGAPVAQTISFQGALAGSATNQASANTTIVGSLGTGTGTNGDLIFQTGVKTSTGTAQATATTALTIKGESQESDFTTTTIKQTLSQNGETFTAVLNPNTAGTAAQATVYVGAALTGGTYGYLTRWGASFSASGAAQPSTIGLVSSDTGGLNIIAANGGGQVSIYTGGAAAGNKAFAVSSAGLISVPLIGSDATHTDSTVCQDTTSHALYSGSGAAGICLGTSSVRFKTDIVRLEFGLKELMKVETVSYRYREGYGDPSRILYGFTAEQMIRILPGLVGLDERGLPNSVDWAGIVPITIRAIQELKADNDNLRTRINELERKDAR